MGLDGELGGSLYLYFNGQNVVVIFIFTHKLKLVEYVNNSSGINEKFMNITSSKK